MEQQRAYGIFTPPHTHASTSTTPHHPHPHTTPSYPLSCARDPAKAASLGAVFEALLKSMDASGSLPGSSAAASSSSAAGGNGDASTAGTSGGGDANGGGAGAECDRTWVLHYLAQHWDRQGDTRRALECVDAALAGCPELIELLTNKAKVLKHAGDPEGERVCVDGGGGAQACGRPGGRAGSCVDGGGRGVGAG